jgi:3'-phosphoadenosine 5'-phosphosulfate sulfotransferase (PAPS reductase)/FAD synthetase
LIDLEFVGLREAESKIRRILIRKYGPIHNSKRWGRFVAWPMRRWTAEDSLAYIDEHNLPLHPAYLRVKFAERQKIRVSWLYDDQWAADDSAELCRRYYPRVYAKLKREGIIP